MFARYQTFDYPYASKIKPALMNVISEYYNGNPVRGGGKRTNQDLHKKGIKEVDKLLLWIKNLMPDAASEFAGGMNRNLYPGIGGVGGFDCHNLKIDTCWGISYGKGDSVMKHNHFPYPLAFCYYVNASEESSPFILEGERIVTVEGRLILFLGHQFHWVSPSNNDGRCAIIGNIQYVS